MLRRTALSTKELRRGEVLARVKAGELSVTDAARLMRTSYRQAKRLWKRYREKGTAGLKHGNAGRISNRARPMKERRKILDRVAARYEGFGPTLAAEQLAAEKLSVHPETLRRWMLEESLWSPARVRKQHRKRRQRRAHFGELVQLDGSFHEWYQDRGGKSCLMNMVDDATSTGQARIEDQETTWGAVHVLRQWIDKYGVPLALYTDWKNVYVREPTSREELKGIVPLTQFGRMCQKLGIEIIAANSPEAKGRVERSNGIHQDRLIKKMGLKRISDHRTANRFLEDEYLPDHNTRFSVKPAKPQDYHRPAPPPKELDQVFCLETERTVYNDWIVRYESHYFQLDKQSGYAPARSKVTVREWEDGRIEIRYRDKAHAFQEIPGPTRKPPEEKTQTRRRSIKKPATQHPWRKPWSPLGAAIAKRKAATSATP